MNKQILVVGSAGGIGLALTRALLAEGASVIGTVLSDDEMKKVREAEPHVTDLIKLDLSNADQALATLEAYVASLPRPLDAVALCAAIGPVGPAETAPLQQFRNVFEVNVIAQLAVVKATIDSLRQSRGRILFLSSILGRIGMPFFPAYCSAKFALEGLADVLRRELSPWGLDVIVAEPGGVRTDMTAQQLRWSAERLAALEEPERSRYGALYRGHQQMAESGAEASAEPQAIAAALVEALTAERPETRYVIGADAHGFLDAYLPQDDRGRDRFLLSLFGMEAPSIPSPM